LVTIEQLLSARRSVAELTRQQALTLLIEALERLRADLDLGEPAALGLAGPSAGMNDIFVETVVAR